jgi:hypothetical protein
MLIDCEPIIGFKRIKNLAPFFCCLMLVSNLTFHFWMENIMALPASKFLNVLQNTDDGHQSGIVTWEPMVSSYAGSLKVL